MENIGPANVFHDFHDFPTIGWGHSLKIMEIMEIIGPANVSSLELENIGRTNVFEDTIVKALVLPMFSSGA